MLIVTFMRLQCSKFKEGVSVPVLSESVIDFLLSSELSCVKNGHEIRTKRTKVWTIHRTNLKQQSYCWSFEQ